MKYLPILLDLLYVFVYWCAYVLDVRACEILVYLIP